MGPPEIEPRSYHLIRKPILWNMTLFPSNRREILVQRHEVVAHMTRNPRNKAIRT